LLLAHCGHNWGYYTLLTEIPTYLKNIQHFSLEDNGFMSALPYICMSAFSFIFSPIADWLVIKGHLSLGATRFVAIRIKNLNVSFLYFVFLLYSSHVIDYFILLGN